MASKGRAGDAKTTTPSPNQVSALRNLQAIAKRAEVMNRERLQIWEATKELARHESELVDAVNCYDSLFGLVVVALNEMDELSNSGAATANPEAVIMTLRQNVAVLMPILEKTKRTLDRRVVRASLHIQHLVVDNGWKRGPTAPLPIPPPPSPKKRRPARNRYQSRHHHHRRRRRRTHSQ